MYDTPMKALVFGSKGYLGTHFIELFDDAIGSSADIADPQAVAAELDAHTPDVVINCAGKTGRPNVDWCEDHKEETIKSNVTGPLVLLEECGKRDIYWAHVGSGCIYEGSEEQLFTEEDPPNFAGSFYARSKAWIDQILKDFPVLTLRLRMPFDGSENPRSLIQKIKKYERVIDVPNSLSYLPDFLDASKQLIEKRATGIFNVVNPGAISPLRVMELYQEIVDPAHQVEKLALEDLSEVAKAGRSNCVLSTAKLEEQGIVLQDVELAVREALHVLGNQ